ncbi:metalloregulator ArsR/SmtB family transcription factor [Luteibacter sp. ME-Dv--P-043b]|uniref:ArsR/SmtB family transcription factor n=1 Tax=Luteibacter sp. ME-Dv--P-043b TaxID=3040291 RepID=UPI0025566461|nr:metalloregulator ArsR/SmtB family transcription factor [Luteibacter sp. ME-Dv--P-043b]
MTTPNAIDALAALAQESRLAIFRLLIEHAPDGLAVGAIGEALGVPSATLSFHLKELAHAGLVSSRQAGRFIYYSPVLGTVNDLVGFLTENCCAASGSVCATPAPSRGKRAAPRSR